MRKFTEEDLDACWLCFKTHFVDILNNEYDLEEARDDLRSLIGTKYDSREQKVV